MPRLEPQIISLPEGRFETELQFFDSSSDKKLLSKIYSLWVGLSDVLQKHRGRRLNIPEILSEGVFCHEYGAARVTHGISGANTSWDCFSPLLKETEKQQKDRRIQVKACSVKFDLTSFGPDSQWDDLYFMHFFPNGVYDGSYHIFHIPNDLIYNHKVNSWQTFQDQQIEGRRPRFGIMKEIIIPRGISPVRVGKLLV